ncbi:MAG: YfhO family protein [Bacteroidota bacterium]
MANKQKKYHKKNIPSSRVEHKNNNHPTSNFFSFVDTYSERTKTFLAFLLIFIVGFFVYKNYLFFHSIFLFKDIGSDTLNYNYPNWLYISSYLRSEGIPQWSFNQGMGQNIFFTPSGISDPFCWLLYLLGSESLPYGIGYMEFFKVLTGGIFFYLYIRILGFTFYSSVIGALLFSFCGYMILGGTWSMFSSEAVGAALLLFAFEKFYKKKSWAWLPIAVTYLIILQPFHIYLYGLLLGVYAIVRFVNQEKFAIKTFSLFIFKISLCCLLGAGISSVFLFSSLLQILESPRGGGDVSYLHFLSSQPIFQSADKLNNISAIMRLFSSDLLGSGSNFHGWENYLEAPILYCSLPALLLIPQVFLICNKKEKMIYAILAGGCLLAILFPFFRYTFWLYTGNYYRTFSFFVTLLILFYAIKVLNHIDLHGKINLPLLIATLIVLIILLSIPYTSENKKGLIDNNLKGIVFFLLFIYTIIIALFKGQKFIIKPILLILICVELCYFSSLTVNRRDTVKAQELKEKIGYNDYTVEAAEFLKEHDKSFYRIDKDYYSGQAMHQSMNDAKAQNYYGTSSYYPFNQKHYISFLQGVGIISKVVNDPRYPPEYQIRIAESNTRWAAGLGGRPILESLMSVKYHFFKNHKAIKFGFDSIAQFGDVLVTKNKYCFPLGISFNQYVLQSEFEKLSFLQKDFVLLRAVVTNDDETYKYKHLQHFNLSDTLSQYSLEAFENYIKHLQQDTLAMVEQHQNKIIGKIHLNEKKILMLSIPYDKGWTAIVDGKDAELQLINIGFMGLPLDKGDHAITLSYHSPFLYTGGCVSLASLVLYLILIIMRNKIRQKLIFTDVNF